MGYVKIPAATNRTVDFTSSGTWTCPSGVYSAEFLVVGAGGGGGGADNSVNTRTAAGAGGGGGAVKIVNLPVTPGSSYTITVGAAGTGGNATAGTSGGFSEVVLSGTTLIRSFGGFGGAGVDATDAIIRGTLTRTIAGGSGTAISSATVTNTRAGGGGNGGFNVDLSNYGSTDYSIEGSVGGNASAAGSRGRPSGFLYGNGGGGGAAGQA